MKIHHLTHSTHSALSFNTTQPTQSWSRITSKSPIKSSITPRSTAGTYQKISARNHSPSPIRYNTERSPVKSIDTDLNKLLNKMVALQQEMKKQHTSIHPIISRHSTRTLQQPKSPSPSPQKRKEPKQIQKYQAKKIPKIESTPQTSYKSINNSQTLSIRSFVLGKLLGQGKFGQVFLSLHKLTGTLYAIKKVFKSIVQQLKIQNQLFNEVCILSQLNHPNIIKLYTCMTDQYHVFMVTQYVPGKTLQKYFNQQQDVVSQIILQVIKGLSYIHSKFIMHRDIKPQNIMYDNGIVKIGDFGWATTFKNRKSTTYCGTLDYVSPQVLQGKQYDNSVDLWSLGILTYQLLSGKTPFKQSTKQKQMQSIKTCNRKRIQYPSCISSLAQDFISKLLVKQPLSRMQLNEAQKHPFITKYSKQFKIARDLSKLF